MHKDNLWNFVYLSLDLMALGYFRNIATLFSHSSVSVHQVEFLDESHHLKKEELYIFLGIQDFIIAIETDEECNR